MPPLSDSSMTSLTMSSERNYQGAALGFLERREVPIITNLEPFYPKEKQPGEIKGTKSIQVDMTLDRTA